MPFLAVAAAALAGCTPAAGPPVLSFPPEDYARAFDAALEAAREVGLQPVVVDRELGVIETGARTAGSALEPWRLDNDGLADTFAHTVNFERRRARFEFVPASFSMPAPAPEAPSLGPAIPGSDRAEARFDLLRTREPIEMRAWVYVDRGFRPNQRIGRWSLSETSYAQDPATRQESGDPSTRIDTEWTPVGRDVPYEGRIMGRIRELLQQPSPRVLTRLSGPQ